LSRFLSDAVKENAELRDLESLFMGIQMACKTIASLVNRAGLVYSITEDIRDDITDGRFYSMKRLDHLSTVVLKNALKYTGKCEVLAPKSRLDNESPAQHQPGVLIAKSMDSNYVACLDPLDGSGNADASICTGTVFGVFEKETSTGISLWKKSREDRDRELVDSVLQPGKNMRAAGYCLYSSATVLVFTLGESVQGFTLDPQMQEFVLTHPDLTIPKRGSVYSCNEANSEGWDDAYNSYLRNLKTGKGETGKRYAHRYVGSMVGDIHRTLLYGGIFAYPADRLEHPDGNLQLLYKAAPMAYIVHTAGGKAIDGRSGSLLEVRPDRVHQKSPCFIGSYDDVSEWESYLSDNEGIYYKKGRD
jgi:fructose-1,6-bisphosphatase I